MHQITKKTGKYFFNSLPKYLVSNRRIIFRGDFYCILNSSYDNMGKGSNSNFGNVGS